MICKINIDGNPFQFEIGGDFSYGPDEILYQKHPILNNCSWENIGFKVIELLEKEEFKTLERQTLSIINKIITSELETDKKNLERLSDYHKVIKRDDEHQKIISKTRFLKSSDFSIDLNRISTRISAIIGKKVGIFNPKLDDEIIILRISRPQTFDINPLHRDGYLGIWENTINVWIPLAGCNKRSTLPVIPGSHLWNEKEVLRTEAKGATINRLNYHVPGIISGPENELNTVRPNPANGEALIFTPFIVHGAAINQNIDDTRMSLEFRLCLQ